MATLNVSFTFTTDSQGFSANAGSSVTMTSNTGSLVSSRAVKGNSGADSSWTLATTWVGLGVPAGSTIRSVTAASMQSRCTAFTSAGAGNTSGAATLVDGGTTVTLSSQRSITGTDASPVTTNGVDSTGLALPSAHSITLTIPNHLQNSNTTGSTVTLSQDTLSFTITYDPQPLMGRIVGQERPGPLERPGVPHLVGLSRNLGVQGPNVRPPVRDSTAPPAFVLQASLPMQAVLFAGVIASAVAAVSLPAIGAPQAVREPARALSAAGIVGDPAVGGSNLSLTWQEPVKQPPPALFAGVAGSIQFLIPIQVSQEPVRQPVAQPRYLTPPVIAPQSGTQVFTRQQPVVQPIARARYATLYDVGYGPAPIMVEQEPVPWYRSQFSPGVPGLSVQAIATRYVIRVQQEITDHPRSTFGRPIVTTPAASTAESRRGIFTQPEAPAYLRSYSRSGVQGPNVKTPAIDYILTRQLVPGHPGPITRPSVVLPDRVAPTRRSLLVLQMSPYHPTSHGRYGTIQGTTKAATTDYVVTSQVRPDHPVSTLGFGVPPISPSAPVPPVRRIFLVRQEAPYHPSGPTQASIQGPDVRTAIQDSTVTRQEIPFHPDTRMTLPGILGPDVRTATTNYLLTRQVVPERIVSISLAGVPAPTIISPESRSLGLDIVVQQLPDHPRGSWLSGVPGPDVRVPVTDRLVVLQEIPGHPGSLFRVSLPPRITVEPTTRLVLVTQEHPGHPGNGFVAGVPGRDVRIVTDRVFVYQEGVAQPGPVIQSSTPLPSIAGVRRFLITTASSPDHPSTLLRSGVLSSRRTPVVDRLVTAQQLPDHPRSVIVPGMRVTFRESIVDYVFTIQETPDHVPPLFQLGVEPFHIPGFDVLQSTGAIVLQEVPGHPGSYLLRGNLYSIVRPGVRLHLTADLILASGLELDELLLSQIILDMMES